jgi:hypothetical protein
MADDWINKLSGSDRDAAAAVIQLFESYGLGSLAPKIVDFIQQGFSGDTLILLLQDTTEYETRFKGNEVRQQAGLPVLSPADYLRTEEGYRQALQSTGMPAGFYDSYEDFQKWISMDVAPAEIQHRADQARKLINTIDPLQRDILLRTTGLSVDDMAAYYLDTDVASPILERQIETVMLGAERERAGFDYSQTAAELLYGQGITVAQAREGYGRIAEQAPTLQKLGEIEGQEVTVSDLEEAEFGQSGEAKLRQQRLVQGEQARFGGRSGVRVESLRRQRKFGT